jgi:hypothetical protein
VVVEVGLTVAEPFVPNTPKPEISTEVARVALQLKTLNAPLAMVAGCAVRVIEGCWGGPAITVMRIEEVTAPPGPAAVARKVVVLLGVTTTDPIAGNVPSPAMVTEVAWVDCQLRTDEDPLLMEGG